MSDYRPLKKRASSKASFRTNEQAMMAYMNLINLKVDMVIASQTNRNLNEAVESVDKQLKKLSADLENIFYTDKEEL